MVCGGRTGRLYSTAAVCVLIAGLLITGLGLYRDYGISWDEPVQREYGTQVYAYAFGDDESLLADRHRVYGPVFEVLLVSLEKGLGLEDLRDIYFMRHLVTFLMFAAGTVFFSLLAARMLGDWRLGLVGAVLMVLTPRIFAHAFYNSKDIPFMAMFIVCMYTLLVCLDRPGAGPSLVHGACCAVLVDMRIVGVLVPFITLVFFIFNLAARRGAGPGAARWAMSLGLFCGALVPLTILLWPTLWTDPVGNFILAFQAMHRFAWRATVLFMGREVWSTDLPAYYVPVYILITLPLMYLALAITGIAAAARRLAGRETGMTVKRRDALLALIWLFVPVTFLIASGAVLYDTWRHTFFVYPAVLLLALMGLGWLVGPAHKVRVRAAGEVSAQVAAVTPRNVMAVAVATLLFVNVCGAVWFMIRSHPHQNVYFNALVGGVRGAAGEYEMDYWGLSYRKLLESVLERDSRGSITLNSLNEPGYYNSFILPPGERGRLAYTDQPAAADYYISNHRWERFRLPADMEAASVEVDGVTLCTAYRLR
jgi:hypothetical protein